MSGRREYIAAAVLQNQRWILFFPPRYMELHITGQSSCTRVETMLVFRVRLVASEYITSGRNFALHEDDTSCYVWLKFIYLPRRERKFFHCQFRPYITRTLPHKEFVLTRIEPSMIFISLRKIRHTFLNHPLCSCKLKLICGNKMPTRCNRGFYCRSYCLLNMFRASLCPSSGAQGIIQWLLRVVFCAVVFQVAGLVWS